MENGETLTSVPVGQKLDTRASVAQNYGLGRTSVARLLRLNYLIDDFRQMVDAGSLALRVADDLSFLSEQEQRWVFEAAQELRYKLTMNSVKLFRDSSLPLTKELICGMMQGAQSESKPKVPVRKVSVSRSVYDQYFKGSSENEIQSVIDQALAAWFAAGN